MPRYVRPNRSSGTNKAVSAPLPEEARIAIANRVTYMCSRKHKYPSKSGTQCPREFGWDIARPLEMLRLGILKGAHSPVETNELPGRIWYYDPDFGYFEAQQGGNTPTDYHGYLLKELITVPPKIKQIKWQD